MNSLALPSTYVGGFAWNTPLKSRRKQLNLVDPRRSLRNLIVRASESRGKVRDEHERVQIKLEPMRSNRKRAARQAVATVLQVDRARLMDVDSISRKSARLLPQALLEALDERIRARQWKSALKIFGLLRVQEWYEHKEEIYIKLLMMLGKCKLPDVASELFEVMVEKDKIVPSLKSFTALLYAYMNCGSSHVNPAFALFEHLKNLPEYQPDVHVYSVMIRGCCESGLFDRASLLLLEMWDQGVKPNVITYNTLIQAFGKVGMLSQMEEVFFHILKSGAFKPDIWTWNIIIKNFGIRGSIDKMEHWFELLQKAGVQPDNVTFNAMVSAYGRKRLFAKMKSVVIYMRKYLYKVDEVAFNTMIEAYGKAGMVVEMGQTFNAMKRAGVKFTPFTLSSLISAYSKKGMWPSVEKVRRQWENSDLVPDVTLYNALIYAYGKEGKAEEMQSAFLEMKSAGLEPDQVTYSTLLEGYRSLKKEAEAENVLEAMRSLQSKKMK